MQQLPKLFNLSLQGQEVEHVELIEATEDGEAFVLAHYLRESMVMSWFVLGHPISRVASLVSPRWPSVAHRRLRGAWGRFRFGCLEFHVRKSRVN